MTNSHMRASPGQWLFVCIIYMYNTDDTMIILTNWISLGNACLIHWYDKWTFYQEGLMKLHKV